MSRIKILRLIGTANVMQSFYLGHNGEMSHTNPGKHQTGNLLIASIHLSSTPQTVTNGARHDRRVDKQVTV